MIHWSINLLIFDLFQIQISLLESSRCRRQTIFHRRGIISNIVMFQQILLFYCLIKDSIDLRFCKNAKNREQDEDKILSSINITHITVEYPDTILSCEH